MSDFNTNDAIISEMNKAINRLFGLNYRLEVRIATLESEIEKLRSGEGVV